MKGAKIYIAVKEEKKVTGGLERMKNMLFVESKIFFGMLLASSPLLLSSPAAGAGNSVPGVVSADDKPLAAVSYNDNYANAQEGKAVAVDSQEIPQEEPESFFNDEEGHVFGYQDGYFHASLALSGEWTDNLYNYDSDKQENWLTRISPSVWLTWPRRAKRPLHLAVDNTAVGGLQYSPDEYDVYNKFQVYLAGNLSYMTYSADSELDHVENGVQGSIMYKPAERLTLQLMDGYSHSQDIFNILEATPENDRVYDSNVFGASANWQFSDKLSVEVGYANHLLMYDLDLNNFMDRSDQGFNGALAYHYSPKTDFFLSYSLLGVGYDEDEQPDNTNEFWNAGINWHATVKTSLMLKAGYQSVEYDDAWKSSNAQGVADIINNGDDAFNFEMQGTWQATPKSQFLVNSKYSIEQTDSKYALNKTVFAARLAYGYRFTDRLKGDINFIYEDSDYAQFDGTSRLDERWNWGPSVQYAVKKWLSLYLYYNFDKKDSNYDELDYETNVLGAGITGSF